MGIYEWLETNKTQLATYVRATIDVDLNYQRGTRLFARTSSIPFNARYNSQAQNERIYFTFSGINTQDGADLSIKSFISCVN